MVGTLSNISNKEDSRILLLSLRNLDQHVSGCLINEFEDMVCALDAVKILAPIISTNLVSKLTNKSAKYIEKLTGKRRIINQPKFEKIVINKEYDLFLFVCQHPFQIPYINLLKNWRKKCRKAALWLDEIWVKDVEKWKEELQLLKSFDCIFMNFSSSIDAVAAKIQPPCHHLPLGVDAIKFCPYPLQPQRSIDVYSIGRRPPVTHKALVELVERGNFFYVYQTTNGLYTNDWREHRNLYSNLLKRSRYFMVNKAKFDLDAETGGQEELGARFFEGAAAGAVLLGLPPACDTYRKYFDWSDAVIHVSDNASNIAEIISDLNTQTDRLLEVSRNNVVNTLLRSDWVYRWEEILNTVGLKQTSRMRSRKAYLQNLAETVGTHKEVAESLNLLP